MNQCWNCKRSLDLAEDKGNYYLCSCGASNNKKEVVLQGPGLGGTQEGSDGAKTGKANPIPARRAPKRKKVIETATIPVRVQPPKPKPLNPIFLSRAIKGVKFPINGYNVLVLAKENGAAKEVIETLSRLPMRAYESVIDITKEIKKGV